ncbi:hypothetical protein B6U80_01945 [Candidatus Pacearchaeota archaeon ex4484_26]|nr:MAG: hypothetical protein B6U80_01945 [Candidatus Pacearchaeota archaeon ex4484_26]
MAKETKKEKSEEKIYIIPLRREWEKVPRYKRAKKAVKAIKEFLVRHMKIYDRDLRKIKIGRWLNMHVWQRGIKKPPIKVKIKAVKEGEIIRAELAELPKKALKEEAKKKAKEEAAKKKPSKPELRTERPTTEEKEEERKKEVGKVEQGQGQEQKTPTEKIKKEGKDVIQEKDIEKKEKKVEEKAG